jgi:hypothetical protein
MTDATRSAAILLYRYDNCRLMIIRLGQHHKASNNLLHRVRRNGCQVGRMQQSKLWDSLGDDYDFLSIMSHSRALKAMKACLWVLAASIVTLLSIDC